MRWPVGGARASQGNAATGPPPSFASCFRLWYEGVGEQSLQRQLLLDDAASMEPVVDCLPPRRLLPQVPWKERQRRPKRPGRQRGVRHRIRLVVQTQRLV